MAGRVGRSNGTGEMKETNVAISGTVAVSGLLYSAQAQDTHPAVLIRTDAGSSPSFNASATRRYEGTVSRNDSEMAPGESKA